MNHDDRRLLHLSAADSLAPLINLALRRNDALAVFNHAVRLLPPACPFCRHLVCKPAGYWCLLSPIACQACSHAAHASALRTNNLRRSCHRSTCGRQRMRCRHGTVCTSCSICRPSLTHQPPRWGMGCWCAWLPRQSQLAAAAQLALACCSQWTACTCSLRAPAGH